MSRLTEKFIKKTAIEYLKEYYTEKYQTEKVFGRDEVRTNTDFKNKRADGLICFHSDKQIEHTVSIEAKSHRTLGSLLSYWNDEKLALHALIISIPLGLLAIIFTHDLSWYWISLITLLSIIFLFFMIVVVIGFVEPNRYKLINVVNQIHRYPANEKWIAISQDSLNLAQKKSNPEFHKNSDYDNFLQICKNQNIGIIVITRRTKEILAEPRFTSGNFLDCYAINEQIREFLK